MKLAMGTPLLDIKHCSGWTQGGYAARGGITVAVKAKIPEPILFSQSGHEKALEGRRYVDSLDLRELYATGCAILGMNPI